MSYTSTGWVYRLGGCQWWLLHTNPRGDWESTTKSLVKGRNASLPPQNDLNLSSRPVPASQMSMDGVSGIVAAAHIHDIYRGAWGAHE